MNNDRVTAILCLLFSIVVIINSSSFPFLGAIFPIVIASTLAAMSILLLIKSFIKPEINDWIKNISYKNVFLVSLGLIIYVSIIPVLGIVTASTIFIVIFSIIYSQHINLKIVSFNVFIAIVFTGLLSYVFIQQFFVPLPSGFFF